MFSLLDVKVFLFFLGPSKQSDGGGWSGRNDNTRSARKRVCPFQ